MNRIDHGKLKYQVLSILKEQSPLTQKEIAEKLANYFNLTEEEREETYFKRPYDKVFYKTVASNEERLRFAGLEDFTPPRSCHYPTRLECVGRESRDNTPQLSQEIPRIPQMGI